MDFHKEAISWWDCWLKGNENKARNLPAYRAYIGENLRPGGYRNFAAGHWVAEPNWPSNNIKESVLFHSEQKTLTTKNTGDGQLSICSPQDSGVAYGEILSLKPDS
jgi:predicted acyl esterase